MVYSIASIHFWLITSRGREAAKFSAKHLLIAAGINIALNYFLIPELQISGAVIATIFASLYLIAVSTRFFKQKAPLNEEKAT